MIAFDSLRLSQAHPSQWQIYTIGVDGRGLRRLTNEAENARPAWSPDRKRIAFWRSVVSANPFREEDFVVVMNADGTGLERLTNNGIDPAWSPDGRRIGFVREGDLWLMDANGTAQHRITRDAERPAWSPDGARIAFVRQTKEGRFYIWVVNIDGTGETRLAGGEDGMEPDWSPDGRRLAFAKSADPIDTTTREIWVVNADGSGEAFHRPQSQAPRQERRRHVGSL